MRSWACADGRQPNARLESHLWLLSALVQSSREAQTAALRCLPDLTQLLDTGVAIECIPIILKTKRLDHCSACSLSSLHVHGCMQSSAGFTTPMRCGMHAGPRGCQ